MLLRRITDFILQSRLHAMGTAFGCAFIPWVGAISIVIAAFVTLRKGAREGAFVMLAATLPLLIGYWTFPADNQTSALLTDSNLMLLMVVGNILTWLFSVILRHYANWSWLLQLAAVLSIIVVCVVHLVYPDAQSWWGVELKNYFTQTMQNMDAAKLTDDSTQSAIASIAESVKPYATGIITVFIVFNALLQLLIARWWQAVVFNPGGLRKEMYEIRMSYIAGALFVLGLALSFWVGSDWITDVMPIFYLIFCLAGLSLLHSLISRSKVSWFWLSLVYLSVMLAPICLTLIAMIALLDTWLDLRVRLVKKG